MSTTTAGIDTLPNEVLIQVLELFSTKSLLPLAGTCRRFYGLVSRLHYARLVEAVAPQGHDLILECYHPSAKISTPYMFCDYIDTDEFESAGLEPTLRKMNGLYSRFRPVLEKENQRPRARYPTLDVVQGTKDAIVESPSLDVHLDAAELFSQLCTVINVIKVGPKRGLFLSCVNIIESVIRIWRDWLAEQTELGPSESARTDVSHSSILWTDSAHNFGLRLKVVEKPDTPAPVLLGPGEEAPVSYVLEYTELIIRTNQLLLSMEKAEAQQVNHSSKAIVIASM
ncbi:hypothetical protein JX266_009938 [Neoarthrinium moseri]|nr:hypothetical protein JX266_009938 [Neoarthrinium moseri]